MTVKPSEINLIWASGGTTKTVDSSKYNLGWVLEVLDYGHLNTVQQNITQAQKHNNEEGINVWDAVTSYPQNAYTKDANGDIRRSNAANVNENPLTSGDWDLFGSEFEVDTTLVFYQGSAPLNYVQITNIHDFMMVVVQDAGGYTSGTYSPTTPHNHTIGPHAHGTSGASLTVDQLPPHNHYTGWGSAGGGPYGNNENGPVNWGTGAAIDQDNYDYLTSVQGNGNPHYHGNTSSTALSSDFSIATRFAAFILCKRV